MALGPVQPVEAPVYEADPHGLLSSAREVIRTGVDVADDENARWVQGFRFEADGCYTGSFWDPSCVRSGDADADDSDAAVDKSAPQHMPGETLYTPWVMETDVGCNPAGYTWQMFQDRATSRLENLTEDLLEREFWTGATHGVAGGFDPAAADYRQRPNFALQDIVPTPYVRGACSGILNDGTGSGDSAVWEAVDAKTGLAMLVQALSAAQPGGIGFIHTPPQVAELWNTNGSLTEDGDRLLTKVKHHVIVAGGGYPGTGPDGIEPGEDQMWVFATSPVYVRLTDVELVTENVGEAFLRRTNFVDARAERYAAAYCDPARLFGVLITVE